MPLGFAAKLRNAPAKLRSLAARLLRFICGLAPLGSRSRIYRALFDLNPLPAWLYDEITLRLIAVNEAAVAHYGYSREEFLSMSLLEMGPEDEQRRFLDLVAAEPPGQERTGLWRNLTKTRKTILVETTSREIGVMGRSLRLVMVKDVTERERTLERLRNSELRFRGVVEHAGDIIYQTDTKGRFRFCNLAALRILGYTLPQVAGKSYLELVHPAERGAAARFYGRQFLRKKQETYYEFRCISNDANEHWIGQNVQLMFEDGDVIGFQAIARDITARKRLETELAREAGEDVLTGLANRRALVTAIERLIASDRSRGFSICLCDLDRFKLINDTYGHGAGDEALQVLSQILRTATQPGDLPGRLGGDEFCILFPESLCEEAAAAVEGIRLRISTVCIGIDDRPFNVTASFGVAEWRPGMASKDLLAAADAALYAAKQRGRDCVATEVRQRAR